MTVKIQVPDPSITFVQAAQAIDAAQREYLMTRCEFKSSALSCLETACKLLLRGRPDLAVMWAQESFAYMRGLDSDVRLVVNPNLTSFA